MATQKAGLHHFVNRGGNVTGDVHDMKAGYQAQSPANGLPSTGSFDRRGVAENARVTTRHTKLENSNNGRIDYLANAPRSAAELADSQGSNPAFRSMNAILKQEHSQEQANTHNGFDTDAENVDDTSTMSVDVQVKDSQSQHPQFNNMQRAPDIPYSSAIPAEHVYYEDGRDRFDDHSPYEEHDGLEEENSMDEEGGESDESADEEHAEEDPTLNSHAMSVLARKGFIEPGQEEDFDRFSRMLHEKTFAAREIPILEDQVRPSSQTNSRHPHGRHSNGNHARSTHRSAGNEVREQAQPASMSGKAPVVAQQALYQAHGKFSDAPATQSRSYTAGGMGLVQAERQRPQSQTRRLQVSSPNIMTTIPQHLKNMQGTASDAREPSSDIPVIEALNERSPEEAPDFAQQEPYANHKRALEPDYSGAELSQMTYDQLKSEAFDHDPKAPPSILPTALQSEPLEHQLTHIFNLPTPSDEHPFPDHQTFFASLPIDKYEECGDLILGKFAEILNKFKKARQDKRQICRGFEDEVSKREAVVSKRIAALDRDLGRLRRAGEEVVRGKGA